MSDGRFTNPTQEERGESYSELDTREIVVEMFEDMAYELCASFSIAYIYFELRNTHFHESKFCCHEKSITGYDDENDDESESGVHSLTPL